MPLHCPRNLSSFTRPQGGESESHEFRGFTEVVDPTPGYPCYLRKSNCRPNLDLPNGRLGAWTAGEICWNCPTMECDSPALRGSQSFGMLGVPFRGPKGFNHNPQWLVWMGYGVPFQWSHWYPAPSTNWMQPDELAGHFEPLGQGPPDSNSENLDPPVWC